MTHDRIYAIYKELLPFYYKQTKMYFPCGQNTIRVRLENGRDYVFIFASDNSWSFETLDRYLKKMKGGR